MEPEAHRLDREQLFADRMAVAERLRREVDVLVEAAAEKRRSYLEWFVNHMRIEAKGELERERRWADMRIAFTTSVATERRPVATALRQYESWAEAEVESAPVAWAATG